MLQGKLPDDAIKYINLHTNHTGNRMYRECFSSCAVPSTSTALPNIPIIKNNVLSLLVLSKVTVFIIYSHFHTS